MGACRWVNFYCFFIAFGISNSLIYDLQFIWFSNYICSNWQCLRWGVLLFFSCSCMILKFILWSKRTFFSVIFILNFGCSIYISYVSIWVLVLFVLFEYTYPYYDMKYWLCRFWSMSGQLDGEALFLILLLQQKLAKQFVKIAWLYWK